MKRTIPLAALAALTLAACAGDESTGTAQPTGDEREVVTETVTVEAEAATETVTVTVEAEPTTEEAEATTDETEAAEEEDADGPDFGEQELSERGYLVKALGQPAGIGGNPDDTTTFAVAFTLTDVLKDFQCPSNMADPPANGHYVAFDWEIETGTADAMSEAFYDATFTLNAMDMDVLIDGQRVNDPMGNAMWCAGSDVTLPSSIGPKQTATGLIVLDLPSTEGILVVNGTYFGVESGWEWEF